jgi:hypothetical protein
MWAVIDAAGVDRSRDDHVADRVTAVLRALFRRPLDDYTAALARFAEGWTWARLALLALSAVLSWWMYVPLHELAHALGCWVAGGTVTRLDIDPLYGAALLARVLPFVHVGSDYAGQLSGFDTHGSDAVYLLTDVLPFAMTIAIGVPLLEESAIGNRSPAARAVMFGAALPIAYAPFISVTGDFYEIGSILVSRLAAVLGCVGDATRWRGDDLLRVADRVVGAGGGIGDAVGITLAFVVGVIAAFASYAAGAVWARWMRRVRG